MNITINTDASFCPLTKVGGFAFYIICNDFKIQKAGEFRTKPKNPTEAEAMCIGNAIATLLAQDLPKEVNYIIINTDCLHAISLIKSYDGVYKKVRKFKNRLFRVVRPQRIEFRHVKAHNGTPDARSWVNDWCDKEAKRYMRQARGRITIQN
ncbi:MAG: RNase H family protein [Candidatus Paceibacterota bacterium]